jgi:hypothetical protein
MLLSSFTEAIMSDDGYTTTKWTSGGQDFTCVFYQGFVSSITYTPPGGTPQRVWTQEGIYMCPGGPTGPGPDTECTFTITVGANEPIVLKVDDSPRPPPGYKGPVGGFAVGLQRPGPAPYVPTQARVVPESGADQVASITVRENGSGVKSGGVFANEDPDEGTVGVENDPHTCPFTCP